MNFKAWILSENIEQKFHNFFWLKNKNKHKIKQNKNKNKNKKQKQKNKRSHISYT